MNATVCSPLPAKGPKQRGPSCGFYALGHVMQYWHQKLAGSPQATPQPLPSRTHSEPREASYTVPERDERDVAANAGTFTSLRQVGKFLHVTAFGSVFNAEGIVRVARLRGVTGHADVYDGHVITATSQDDYLAHVLGLIKHECPVIVPFDAESGSGDPVSASGEKAHWGVIFGWYAKDDAKYFVHYHWGEYRYSPASAFAASTHGLTANALRDMMKIEVRNDKGAIFSRGHRLVTQPLPLPPGFSSRPVTGPRPNVEFTNPGHLEPTATLLSDPGLLGQHGFDPSNLTNAGLRDKLVAIYPQHLKPVLGSL